MYDGRVAHQMLYRCSRMHMTPDHISSCGHGAEAGDDANPIEDILSSIKVCREGKFTALLTVSCICVVATCASQMFKS